MTYEGQGVLVVGLNWIGDSIMAMPALQAWRRANPDAPLCMLVKKGLAPLWALHDVPNEVLSYENGIAATGRAVSAVRSHAPARAFVLPHSFRSALIPFLARVPERIGMPGHGRDLMLTRVVNPRLGPGRMHQRYEYADLLVPAAAAQDLERPRLKVSPADQTAARAAQDGLPRPLLGLMPGAARGPAKRWPGARFGEVAHRWLKERKGGVLFLGGREDREECDGWAESLGPGACSLAGRTSLAMWAAHLQACDVVAANDSGGMHLAAAMGVPVVAIFGMTDPDRTGPLGEACRILQAPGGRSRDIARDSAEAQKRLAAISPEQVYQAAVELLPAP